MNSKDCIHCGKCTEACRFLEKYAIDIGDMKKREELAYHCFLCGKCTEVCPAGIDGRETILEMRRREVAENDGRMKQKGFRMLLFEKENYLFANYRNRMGKSAVFPGCNFPSFYPKTTKHLIELLKKEAGAGVVFDCCGKPIAELGLQKKENEILSRIERRLEETGIEELIMLCPNCYHFLKPRLKVKVVSVYEKLSEIGIGSMIDEKIQIFLPCPDRAERQILQHIQKFLKEEPDIIKNVQCCGLGGCAGGKEKKLAMEMAWELAKYSGQSSRKIHTYCASCCGNLARKGCGDAEHLLLKILGETEQPDTKRSIWNRAKTKYFRG
ncbi:MAG: (Fe-S)-binding protein [Lachnospiraceae bacterium]|nr:(Fe-S)-binding protein [Lachnospiraceae bacterium]